MTTINYKSGTEVWVRLDGKRKLAVFKEQLPELWGGRLCSVVVGSREITVDPDSIIDIYEGKKRQ